MDKPVNLKFLGHGIEIVLSLEGQLDNEGIIEASLAFHFHFFYAF